MWVDVAGIHNILHMNSVHGGDDDHDGDIIEFSSD